MISIIAPNAMVLYQACHAIMLIQSFVTLK